MHPQNAVLLDDLKKAALKPDFPNTRCFRFAHVKCDVRVFPVAADGVLRIAISDGYSDIEILARSEGQGWHLEGKANVPQHCSAQRAALFNGEATFGTLTQRTLILGGAPFLISGTGDSCGEAR